MTTSIEDIHRFYTEYVHGERSVSFEDVAIACFQYHIKHNKVYKAWCEAISSSVPASIEEIPFLPIQFFKSHEINVEQRAEAVFTSSGTTGSSVSRHYVYDTEVYKTSFRTGWKEAYGDVQGTCVLGLLPSYLERQGSSLIYMVDDMIRESKHEDSGFYLDDFEGLHTTLRFLCEKKVPTVLIGVSFALLDFVEQYAIEFPDLIVMETGGMKGRREEMTRSELHGQLSRGFGVEHIHSEYGMTELLSQAYSRQDGLFFPARTMRCLLREIEDPLTVHTRKRRSGLINCIDLSNLYSCPFIATDDIGRLYEDGSFAILGRMDYADVRGCNLMVI